MHEIGYYVSVEDYVLGMEIVNEAAPLLMQRSLLLRIDIDYQQVELGKNLLC